MKCTTCKINPAVILASSVGPCEPCYQAARVPINASSAAANTPLQSSPIGLAGCDGPHGTYAGSITEWLHNNPGIVVMVGAGDTIDPTYIYSDTNKQLHWASHESGKYKPLDPKYNYIPEFLTCASVIGPK